MDAVLQGYAVMAEASGTQTSRMMSSEHFYTGRVDTKQMFKPGKRWLMETMYRQIRVRHRLLLDLAGEPEGSQWNFDAENRKAWQGDPVEPMDFRPSHDHGLLWKEIQAAGVNTLGLTSANAIRWPFDRDEALQQLEAFIAHSLPHFVDSPDAMSLKA